jgi:hypothetical protein
MRKATKQGLIKGVMTHLIPEGISHIQYADDIPALNGYLD